ncbi:MAG TPA: dephospho-CoA kinase, partial [Vicinamibacteria bacterium]|nr:dephospho-CoA kinase [Vicinamibacteria bacterium]
MLKVGLTGGIACGKTHVARRLASRALHVLDLDTVAHELTAPGGAAYEDVVRAFGAGILGAAGAIDRQALAARVFADPEALGRLNALVHPRVREEETRRARALAGTGAVLVTDAALLVESGLHLRFDRLVVVDCRPEQQVRRLAARDGMTEETARARLAAQMPVAEKRRFAHLLIDASASVEETDRATDAVTETLRGLAARDVVRVAVPAERALGALLHGPAQGPRGLTPALLLREIVEAGGLEMERASARLAPPPTGPWYRAAGAESGGPGPETLAVPVALFALARRGYDPEYTASAAASVGRLTHREPRALGDAVLMALALAAVASGGLDEARR